MAQGDWRDTWAPLEQLEEVLKDASWTELLPSGSSIISVAGYGASNFSQSGKIECRLADGSVENFFIKLTKTPTHLGRTMVQGEFESIKTLHTISPHLVPKPIGYGAFSSDNNTHFFLCSFVDFEHKVPTERSLCAALADLHSRSQTHSFNGKFGFQVPTCNGTAEQYTRWTSSWEEFFIESLKRAFKQEEEVHGPSTAIAELLPAICDKVCPRLLRPLETECRTLKPSLVHGDLWEGNIAVHAGTDEPCIFDSSALWAHNEYEMHIWRGARYKVGASFVRRYFELAGKSEPEEDAEDRGLLYSLVADLHSSIVFKQSEEFRGLLVRSMRVLVGKFPGGYQGRAERKGEGGQPYNSIV